MKKHDKMEPKQALYFIPILAEAFENPDVSNGLAKAIKQITELGALPEFSMGYQQFLDLFDFSLAELEANPAKMQHIIHSILSKLMIEDTLNIAGDETDRLSYLTKDNISSGNLRDQINLIKENMVKIESDHSALEVQYFHNGRFISEHSVSSGITHVEIIKVKPGFVSLRLSNGRILWEFDIPPELLIWQQAYPGDSFKLAADTKDESKQSTWSEIISRIPMQIEIFPGLESGTLILTFNRE